MLHAKEASIRYCTTCGTELVEAARYCGTCGAPVAVLTPPQQTPPPDAGPVAAPPLPPPAPAGVQELPPSVKISSPMRRFGAWALDLVLLIVTLFIGWLIWSLIVWGRGQSPGKQLLGMRVIRSDTHRVVSWGRMALREIVCKGVIGFAASVTVVGFVLYLWLLWDNETQELWDKMASTIVVDDSQRALAPA